MDKNVYNLSDIKRAVANGSKLMFVTLPKRLCLIDLKAKSQIGDTVATYNNDKLHIIKRSRNTKNIVGKMIWYIDNPRALKEICK